jgi:hypothetical protein
LAQEAEGCGCLTATRQAARSFGDRLHRLSSEIKTSIAGRLIGDLRGLSFFDDLPEVRCQFAIVTRKHLIKGPLRPVLRLPNPLLALGGLGLVLLHFGLKISQHGTTPRNIHTTFDRTFACAEKMARPGNFCSVKTTCDQGRKRTVSDLDTGRRWMADMLMKIVATREVDQDAANDPSYARAAANQRLLADTMKEFRTICLSQSLRSTN